MRQRGFVPARQQRLELHRSERDAGRISLDDLLDAVSKHSSAIVQESQFRTEYNAAIVGLEETKGTLLEHYQITVVEGPTAAASMVALPVGATKSARDKPTALAFTPTLASPLSQPTALLPTAPAIRLDGSKAQSKDRNPKADPGGKTFTFQVTVSFGSQPVEIRGSFAITTARSADARNQEFSPDRALRRSSSP